MGVCLATLGEPMARCARPAIGAAAAEMSTWLEIRYPQGVHSKLGVETSSEGGPLWMSPRSA